jgi:hypothetical protein
LETEFFGRFRLVPLIHLQRLFEKPTAVGFYFLMVQVGCDGRPLCAAGVAYVHKSMGKVDPLQVCMECKAGDALTVRHSRQRRPIRNGGFTLDKVLSLLAV